jgi:hypothetical protein
MNNKALLILTAIFACVGRISAQVGIGTSTPNASAQLEISSSSKGFLPPRVALTGTADVTTIASPATGLMVYNTATAGTSPANVTPGIYYYDGAKWQRVINQQPDATVEFNTADPNSGSPTFTPNTPASKDYVYVSSVDNSQWTHNGTAYVTYTPPASTAWYAQSSTTDAGSNKTSGMYRTGNVGIGTTSFAPSTKLHVVSSTAGGGFRLVDGTQGANKVLQSDANGNASWATNVAVAPAVIGVMGSGAANTTQNAYTGAYITLPNGKWSVSVSMMVVTSSSGDYWIRTGFSASSSTIALGADAVAGGPTLVSGFAHGSGFYSMLNGTLIINNTSGANKTYYYCTGTTGVWNGGTTSAQFQNIGRNVLGENSIVAYPMN